MCTSRRQPLLTKRLNKNLFYLMMHQSFLRWTKEITKWFQDKEQWKGLSLLLLLHSTSIIIKYSLQKKKKNNRNPLQIKLYRILSKVNIWGSTHQPPPFLTKCDFSGLPIIIFPVRAQYKRDFLYRGHFCTQKWSEGWNTSPMKKVWKYLGSSAWERKASRETSLQSFNI